MIAAADVPEDFLKCLVFKNTEKLNADQLRELVHDLLTDEMERIQFAVEASGSKELACRIIGMNKRTMHRRLKSLEI